MRPSLFLLAYGLVLGILVAESSPRGIGDAPEYLAVAANLSRFTEPALKRTQREEYGIAFRGGLTGTNGRQDTIHFWMYPAFVSMPLRLTRVLGLEPAAAFAAVNLALLLIAAALARPQLHWTSFCVLFLSPIIWWIDKIHTEVFSFSLLTIAMCAPARPVLAGVAVGIAATQNPPMAILLPLGAAAGLAGGLPRRRVLLGLALGSLIAAIHPLYYWVRLGRVAPLWEVTAGRPSVESFAAVLLDPNIGLVFNDPWLPLAVLAAVAGSLWQRTWRPTAWHAVAVISALVFLSVFGRVVNLNHGGTPSMSRYALWLIPLAIPFLAGYRPAGGWRVGLSVLAAAGAAWSIALYRPALPERCMFPTKAAEWIWTRYPSLTNPVPEIFAERLLHRENVPPPAAATADCAKVLTWNGSGTAQCPVGIVPAACERQACYANRRRDGSYAFAIPPRPR